MFLFQWFRNIFGNLRYLFNKFVKQYICFLENNGPAILPTLMEYSFDSNLCTLSGGVLPTVKQPEDLPILTSMILMVEKTVVCPLFLSISLEKTLDFE